MPPPEKFRETLADFAVSKSDSQHRCSTRKMCFGLQRRGQPQAAMK